MKYHLRLVRMTIIEKTTHENMTAQTYGMQQKHLRGKFTAIKSYLKKQEKHQIDNLTLHLKQLEKELKKKLVEGKNS